MGRKRSLRGPRFGGGDGFLAAAWEWRWVPRSEDRRSGRRAYLGVRLTVGAGDEKVARLELVFAEQFEEGAAVFSGFAGGVADVAAVTGEQGRKIVSFETADHVGLLLAE